MQRDYFQHDLCLSIHPDYAMAQGAAIQAAILSGMDPNYFKDVLMFDVLPQSIGIAKANGEMEIIIPKNGKILLMITKYFTTYEDNQAGFTIKIYEGEDPIASNNVLIEDFNVIITKSKRALKGEISHPVSLELDENGILHLQSGIHHDNEEDTTMSYGILWGILVTQH